MAKKIDYNTTSINLILSSLRFVPTFTTCLAVTPQAVIIMFKNNKCICWIAFYTSNLLFTIHIIKQSYLFSSGSNPVSFAIKRKIFFKIEYWRRDSKYSSFHFFLFVFITIIPLCWKLYINFAWMFTQTRLTNWYCNLDKFIAVHFSHIHLISVNSCEISSSFISSFWFSDMMFETFLTI